MASLSFKRTKSRCKGCPLDGQTKVAGRCDGTDKPQLAFVGEAPGEQEDYEGKPFVGPAGRFLKLNLTRRANVRSDSAYFTNVLSCRPPNNNISSIEALEAIERCKPGLEEELAWLRKRGVKAICALGNTARDALNSEMRRGYIYEDEGLPLMMSWHPSFILRGMTQEEPTWVNDLAKALSLAQGKTKLIKTNFKLFPSIAEIERWTKELLASKALIGVDIETIGFRAFEARIIVVGIATSKSDAFSIPFLKKGGVSYWSEVSDEKRAWECVRKLMVQCPTMFQNAPYDIVHLTNAGCPILKLKHDVLLAHHALSPELPHSLEYIASCFGSTPNWKDAVKGDARRMIEMEDTKLRTYNLRDCVVLFQCIEPILKELEVDGTLSVYEQLSIPRVELSVELTRNGVHVDPKLVAAWKKDLEKRATKIETEMRVIIRAPLSFSFSSGMMMRWLLFRTEPASLAKKRTELASLKRKDTKKFAQLEAYIKAFNVEPFPHVFIKVKKTETGLESINELSRMALTLGINNRLAALAGLKRPTPEHELERTELERFRHFIARFGDWQEVTKLSSTYANPPIGPDGRVHPWYSIHGTATGRLSSRGPNWQNVPAHSELSHGFRRAVKPEPGYAFVKADYSNLELRVLAYASSDEKLLSDFRNGLSVHDEHAKLFIPGITPADSRWKAVRDATKTFNFGCFAYGGTLRGIFEKIIVQIPELGLTWSHFSQVAERIFAIHPGYLKWKAEMIRQIHETRCVASGFGRKRYLLGSDNDIEREGLNHPIQSTAGELVLEGQLELLNKLRKTDPDSRIVMSVHDDIVVEAPKAHVDSVAKLMETVLAHPRDIPGWGIKGGSFPIEIKTSSVSWQDMVDWEGGRNGKVATVPGRRKAQPLQ